MTNSKPPRFSLDDCPTPLVVHVPLVLAVGCTPAILRRAELVLAPLSVALREVTLVDLRADLIEQRPLVLLIGADLYELDPDEFEASARGVGALLGVAQSPREAEVVLERLLFHLRSMAP